jgi:hypothetical protein
VVVADVLQSSGNGFNQIFLQDGSRHIHISCRELRGLACAPKGNAPYCLRFFHILPSPSALPQRNAWLQPKEMNAYQESADAIPFCTNTIQTPYKFRCKNAFTRDWRLAAFAVKQRSTQRFPKNKKSQTTRLAKKCTGCNF